LKQGPRTISKKIVSFAVFWMIEVLTRLHLR
jgi:hypothetical protein